jgi:hypothetical protein
MSRNAAAEARFSNPVQKAPTLWPLLYRPAHSREPTSGGPAAVAARRQASRGLGQPTAASTRSQAPPSTSSCSRSDG